MVVPLPVGVSDPVRRLRMITDETARRAALAGPGTVGFLFLIGYGVLRIIGEIFREPEALYGAMPLGLSAGQWLSVPMVLIGIAGFVVLRQRGIPPPSPAKR